MEKILDKIYNLIKKNEINNEKEYFLFHKNRYLYILKMFKNFYNDKEKLKFLDLGSHYCHLTIGAKLAGYEALGADLNKFVEETKNRCINYGLDVKKCDLSSENIPFCDNYFDILCFSETLEHLNFHPRKVFKEIYRVLKPGGKIIITTPNLLRLNNRIKILIGKSINNDINNDYSCGTHYREYSSKELIYLLNDAKMDVYSLEYTDFDYPNINKFVKIANKFSGLLLPALKSNIVIIGRK